MRLRIVLLLFLLAGCGISPTGVQDGGEPASGFQPSMRLYFVSGQRLKAVTRPMPWPSLKETLNLLVDGPSKQEQQLGLATELGGWIGTLERVASDDATVRVTVGTPSSAAVPVPVPVPRETVAAQRDRMLWLGQVTCTAAAALAARSNIDADAVTVVVQRGREKFGSFRCSEFPRAAE